MPSERATAIVAAAGSGARLGAGGPKALAELAGRPLLAHALDAVLAARSIGPVVVAAPPGHEDAVARLARGARVVAGGASRSESVAIALREAETELVVVHDAARPLAPSELFEDVLAALAADAGADGAIAAAPLADTVKRADGRTVVETIERAGLWAVQTPQAFRAGALRRALDVPAEALAAATDDAALVERAGGRVLVCPAPRRNLKVTAPEDLELAAALLRSG